MGLLRRIGAGAIVFLGGACSLASLDGLVGDGAADSGSELPPGDTSASHAADVGAADVGEADASGDGGLRCVNLVVNGGFEQQSACRPWTNYGGPAVDGTPARSGGNACSACTTAGGGFINLVTPLTGHTFRPGDVVHFEAWMRAADGKLFAVSAYLYVSTNTATALYSTALLLTNAYQRIAVDYVIPADGGAAQTPAFQFLVNGPTDAGGECLLMDDVSVCVESDGP